MKQLSAVNRTVKALDLGDAHTALVEVARGIAREIDAAGGTAPASLWKELRGALTDLNAAGSTTADDFANLLANLQTSAQQHKD